jgi:hypothetical protein
MEDIQLSQRELIILHEIEHALCRDRRFGRVMRASPQSAWLPASVALLGVASVFLMVVGIRTSDPAVIWTLAGVWPCTLVQAFRLLCRWSATPDDR